MKNRNFLNVFSSSCFQFLVLVFWERERERESLQKSNENVSPSLFLPPSPVLYHCLFFFLTFSFCFLSLFHSLSLSLFVSLSSFLFSLFSVISSHSLYILSFIDSCKQTHRIIDKIQCFLDYLFSSEVVGFFLLE